MKRKALVTGADGFIGSHLTEALVRQGWDVRAFVYYNSFGSRGWLDHVPDDVINKVEIFTGNVKDPFGMKEAMQDRDVVFHLAALIGIPYSYHSPQAYVDTNIIGTLNVVQAARELKTGRVIQTSTSEVYGTALYVPIDEDHPLQGQSPYSATKIAADQLALSYYRSFDVDVAICRPFNTYGPRQSARAVIPTIISQVHGGRKTIKLGSTSPTRDFNYVADTVRGFISMADGDIAGETINFGSNYEISIGETAQAICEIMESDAKVAFDKERERPCKSEVERLWADNSKAKKLCGWEPEYAGIDGFKRGLKETIDWFSNAPEFARYRPDEYSV